MKMIMITYNEAIDSEVMEVLEGCGLKNYTKIVATFGRGSSSGSHLGNDIWPGKNNILYVACEDRQAQQLFLCVKELRKSLGREGIKAFVVPIDEVS